MRKILIIEDDKDILSVLGEIAKSSHFEVILQVTLLSVTQIELIMPDLILLDHWIGTEKGGDLCLLLKQNEATKDIPIVIISTALDVGQIAFDSCADGALIKPFDIEEIEALFEAYLV